MHILAAGDDAPMTLVHAVSVNATQADSLAAEYAACEDPMPIATRLLHAAALVLVLPNGCINSQSPSAPPRVSYACGGATWSAPTSVLAAGDSSGRVFRDATLLEGPSGLFVFGDNVPHFDKSVRTADLFAGEAVGSRGLPAPPGRFTFTQPVALSSPDGIDVYWAEPDSIPDSLAAFGWVQLPLSAVWFATYGAAGWSTPTPVYHGALTWPAQAMDDASGQGSLGAIIFAGETGFVTLSRSMTTVAVQNIASPLAFPLYPSLLRDGNEAVLLFVAGDPSSAHDVNSLFSMRSSDVGQHWGAPTLIHRSGATPGYDARLVRSHDGILHAVWRSAGSAGDFLHHQASSDGGATWGSDDVHDAPAGINELRVAVDHGDRIHVVYGDWSGGAPTGHVDHAVWFGTWQATSHLFAPLRPTNPSIAVSANGDVVIGFLTYSPGIPIKDSPLTSMYSRWRC